MTRSLCAWLASLALFAAPSFASAQNFRSHSFLAPVALEARCQVADGMLLEWTTPIGLGRDPLHAAVLAADMATDQMQESSGQCGAELADAPAPAASTDKAIVAEPSLACEPEAFCPFAHLAATEPVDVIPHAIVADAIVTKGVVAHAIVAKGVVAKHVTPTPNDAKRVDARRVGAAATIVTLEQDAYMPYVIAQNPPVRLNLLPFTYPQSCLLTDRPTQPVVAPSLDLSVLIPGEEQLQFLSRTYRSMQPRLPLACWMDELIWRTSELLAAEGPIVSWCDADKVGRLAADWSVLASEKIGEVSQPALPILARNVAPENAKPVPAANPVQPPAPKEEFVVAAVVLKSAAEELESLASTLRTWGDSLQRVAAAKQPLLR